ncbi:MAG: hypothetical protein K2L20_03415, partial [Ligilactobacillus sp.]|nr:hypothetical protein [Ligilactobacillus sp.]
FLWCEGIIYKENNMDLKKERKATYAAASGGISASIGTYFDFPLWLLILTVLSVTYLSVRLLK